MPERNGRTSVGARIDGRAWRALPAVAVGRFRPAVAGMLADMRSDLIAGRGFLWSPVIFSLAAAIYLTLPFEPGMVAVAIPAAALCGAATAVRITAGRSPVILTAFALAAAGFFAAKLEVELAAGPVLARNRAVTVTGLVVAAEDRGSRGTRLELAVDGMNPQPREGIPERVRVSIRAATVPPPAGARVRVLARLGPPQAPLYPGGYDFARKAYFDGIGGVGFALGGVERLAAGPGPGPAISARIAVERFRAAMSQRIRTTLPGDAGAIAAALIVGDRGSIDPATDEAMRVSGLSHVLSISGLHMALVAACLFGGLRALLALIPAVAARLPLKSVAAAFALAGTFAYLVIAGMDLATQRSAVMIAIALVAVMLGRQPFSLRSVAVAALLVVSLSPNAVLDPGAQMSFAAVTALIAGFESLRDRRIPAPDAGDVSILVRTVLAGGRWIGLSLLTSLLAGLATAPIAIHHFNRSSPLALVANLLATPLVSTAIMPAALVAAFAMPFGIEALPLKVMGQGIDGMLAIAEVVAAVTPGGGIVGRPPLAATLSVVAGGIWLCLWTRRARFPGWIVVLVGLAMGFSGERPGLIVAGDGRRALIVPRDGEAMLVGRADDFETAIWLAAIGDPRRYDDPSLVGRTRCDREACILRAGRSGDFDAPVLAAVVFSPAAFMDECGEASVIVAAITAPDWCSDLSTVIDTTVLGGGGARTFRLDGPLEPGQSATVTETARAIPDPPRPFNIGAP